MLRLQQATWPSQHPTGHQHPRAGVQTFLAQYMRRKPCILPCTVICFWDAFHRSSCVSAFSS